MQSLLGTSGLPLLGREGMMFVEWKNPHRHLRSRGHTEAKAFLIPPVSVLPTFPDYKDINFQLSIWPPHINTTPSCFLWLRGVVGSSSVQRDIPAVPCDTIQELSTEITGVTCLDSPLVLCLPGFCDRNVALNKEKQGHTLRWCISASGQLKITLGQSLQTGGLGIFGKEIK